MRAREIYAIAGAKHAGKDTLAKAINAATAALPPRIGRREPFVIEHFADPLKRMAMAVFGLSHGQVYDVALKEKPLPAPIRMDHYVSAMCAETGLTILPRGKVAATPRHILQFFGTDYVRSVCDDFWVQHLAGFIRKRRRVIVPDLRFPNEEKALRRAGAKIIKVEREGVGDGAAEHESEAHWRSIKADLVVRAVTGNLAIVERVARLIALNRFDSAARYSYSRIGPMLEAYRRGDTVEACSVIMGFGKHRDAEAVRFALDYYGVPRRSTPSNRVGHRTIEGVVCKRCSLCRAWKPIASAFSRSSQSWDGYNSRCSPCSSTTAKVRYAVYDAPLNFRQMERDCARNAKKRKVPFKLTAADIEAAWKRQSGRCAYTGLEMAMERGGWKKASVDRIESSGAYVASNIVLCCLRFNMMKREMSVADFVAACKAVVDRLGA